MRDATGELADGLHLLGLVEATGDLLALGDVGDHPAQPLDLAVVPSHDCDDVPDFAHGAVGGDHPVQQLEVLRLVGRLDEGERRQPVIGMHQRHPEPGLQPLRAGVAEQHLLAAPQIGERFAVRHGGLPHDRVQGADDLLHGVRVGVAQPFLLELAPLGGVADDRHDRVRAIDRHRRQADLHGNLRAIVAQALQAQTRPHRPGPGMLRIRGAIGHVAATQATRDEPLHHDADQLVALVAEQLFGRLVDVLDPPVDAGHDDPVRSGIQQLRQRPAGEPFHAHIPKDGIGVHRLVKEAGRPGA